MTKNKQRIHFIAIGGSVMHNLALSLHREGYIITGSDDKIFEPSKSKLSKAGLLPQELGWHEKKISRELDAVVIGMHAKEDNPELKRALELGIEVYSFPDFIYEKSKDKHRIVIAGSHGKTTIASIVIHVLEQLNRAFDYVVGAQIEGLELSVKLSDAPTIIIEGDEYLSSSLDPTPKMLKYRHHVGLISGISWDHFNVYPTLETYVSQFDKFADSTPKGGTLFYCEEDDLATVIGSKERTDVNSIQYKSHPYKVVEGKTFLNTDGGEIPVQIFGKHNMQNISGAKDILKRLSVSSKDFYRAIQSFSGAKYRLELVNKNGRTAVFRDYAHAPSKLLASTQALKEQFEDMKLVACLELHTFSSLNKQFIQQYKGTFDAPDKAIVYFNPENITRKNMPDLKEKEVKEAFDRRDLEVFTDSTKLKNYLLQQNWKDKNLLLMTSGDFNGIDLTSLSKKILS